jgi:hypothetical protein
VKPDRTKTRIGKARLTGHFGGVWVKDVEAIVRASRLSLRGLRTLAGCFGAMVREAAGEWRTVLVVVVELGPKSSVRHFDELAMASCELTLADIRELTALAVRSQRIALHIVGERISERVAEARCPRKA